jgi:DNA-binding MarR family transcriptional regulator
VRYAAFMTMPTPDQISTLRDAFEAFTRRHKLVDAQGAAKTFNEVDNQTLLYVNRHPGCGPGDVARFLNVPATTISSACDRLVRRQLLSRHRPDADRRAVALALTPEGEAHVASYLKAHDDILRHMLESLSTGERDTFIGLISKIAFDER